MALRIIRKSSSQSQVELIKGSGSNSAQLSVLCCLSQAEKLPALHALMADPWLKEHAEWLILKEKSAETDLRSQLQTMPHAIKILEDAAEPTPALRLRNLIQEAGTEYMVFLPQLLENNPAPIYPQLLKALQQDPALGLVGPALCDHTTIIAAGQELTTQELNYEWVGDTQNVSAQAPAHHLHYLYSGLPMSWWQTFAEGALQVGALPLVLVGLRRSAYLALNWGNQDLKWPWLAQDLAQGLRQKQWRISVLPDLLVLNTDEAKHLEAGAQPAQFKEKWGDLIRPLWQTLYRLHGWQQRQNQFYRSASAEKEVSA